MKTTNKSFTFIALLFCFFLASCNAVAAATPLPTAVSVNTAVPTIVSPTTIPTAVPTIVSPTTIPTAVPTLAPSTLPPVPTTAAIPTAVPPVVTASFADQVMQAFNNADYLWINAHMGSEFTFAGWQAGGSALPPAAAVDQLRTVYFGSGSNPIFQTGIDTTSVLGGVNPLSLWGPETAVTDALYVTGLGSSAHDEAMIILAIDNGGTPYIFGLLSAFGGFAGYSTSTPALSSCTVSSSTDVPIYNRPALAASQFGTLAANEPVLVTMRTQDGWLGFEPGVAQAANVGIFRLRWLAPEATVSQGSGCDGLDVAPAISPTACYFMAMADTAVYTTPDANSTVLATIPSQGYTAVTGQTSSGWYQLDLQDGSLAQVGAGWLNPSDANFNGTCDNLPAVTP